MPTSDEQNAIACLRQPVRAAIAKLLDEAKQLLDQREARDAHQYEKMIRVIQKQIDEAQRVISDFDIKWIQARTPQLTVEEYTTEFGTRGEPYRL